MILHENKVGSINWSRGGSEGILCASETGNRRVDSCSLFLRPNRSKRPSEVLEGVSGRRSRVVWLIIVASPEPLVLFDVFGNLWEFNFPVSIRVLLLLESLLFNDELSLGGGNNRLVLKCLILNVLPSGRSPLNVLFGDNLSFLWAFPLAQ